MTDTRLKSGSVLDANRDAVGTKVTLQVYATRYAYSLDDRVAWVSARGQFQWRAPGTTTWTALKDVLTDSYGRYSYTYTISSTREYRAYFPSVSNVFGHSSNLRTS